MIMPINIYVKSPLRYFGDRYESVGDIVNILQCSKPYDCIYDLCSGAGMIGFNILNQNLAKKCVINDAYPAFKYFWQAVRDDHLALISHYQTLIDKYQTHPENRAELFIKVQNHFNHSKSNDVIYATNFAFVLNHALYHEIKFNHKGLACEHTQDSDQCLLDDAKFSEYVFEIHNIFEKYGENIQLSSEKFQNFSGLYTKNDLVVLDPPFPCTPRTVYYRTNDADKEDIELKKMIDECGRDKIDLFMFYEVVGQGFKNDFLFESERFFHLAPAQENYGIYVENIFMSRSLVSKLDSKLLHNANIMKCSEKNKNWQYDNYVEVANKMQRVLRELGSDLSSESMQFTTPKNMEQNCNIEIQDQLTNIGQNLKS